MPEDLNPYASPAILPSSRPPAPRGGLRSLRIPALGLLALSGLISALWLAVFIVVLGFGVYALFASEPLGRFSGELVERFMVWIAIVAANVVVFIGSCNMLLGRRYRLCYASSVLACIPVLSPFIWLGIPFGIWAFIVLHRRDVKEAFSRIKDRSKARVTVAD